jgi:NADH-quinone oxidoreductase subunit L
MLVSKPLLRISGLLNGVLEARVIDGLVNGVGRLVNYGSRQMRLIQSGQVGAYILLMTIGLLVLFILKYYL